MHRRLTREGIGSFFIEIEGGFVPDFPVILLAATGVIAVFFSIVLF